jgi:hypothetical protein
VSLKDNGIEIGPDVFTFPHERVGIVLSGATITVYTTAPFAIALDDLTEYE